MTTQEIVKWQRKAAELLDEASIVLTEEMKSNIEICEYNLDMYETVGTAIVIYVNTDRVCAKEIVLLPGQLCPEHTHPPFGTYIGKEETFFCRWGEVYLYVPGKFTEHPKGRMPAGREKYFTVHHEIILRPGEQYTLMPQTPHWFQAGPQGAVVSEFSTQSFDKEDIFTDRDIVRTSNVW